MSNAIQLAWNWGTLGKYQAARQTPRTRTSVNAEIGLNYNPSGQSPWEKLNGPGLLFKSCRLHG
eukprot:1820143-Pleurochrysis_carterae.AAC.2